MQTDPHIEYIHKNIITQYNFLANNKTEKLQEQYRKKAERKFQRRLKAYNLKQKAKVKGTKPVVKESLSSIKKEAFSIFQLYIRISKSDEKGFVKLVDTGKKVYYTECDAGHYYPKSNYPQLAFYSDNVRPISKYTNKAQGDNVGVRRESGIVQLLTDYDYKKLVEMACDSEKKSMIRKKDYYTEQIATRAPKAIKEFEVRGLEIPRNLHKYIKKHQKARKKV